MLLKQRVQETLQMQENFDSILKQLEDAKSIVKKEGGKEIYLCNDLEYYSVYKHDL